MKNLKKVIIAVLFLAFIANVQTAFANHGDKVKTKANYMEGDVLRVSTKSGLKLREEPSLNSRVFAKMQMGDEVTVLNTLSFEREQTIELVEGSWVYVDYHGMTGYTFDGFLSKLPLPSNGFSITELIELHYDVVSSRDTVYAGEQMKNTRVYENGIEVMNYYGEGGGYTEVRLPGVRLSEAYVFCMNTMPEFVEFAKRMRVKRNKNKAIIEYSSETEYTEMTIKEEDGVAVISTFSGC